ncbi:glucosidase [candidate division KSB1 bacterium]|nr:glucosidase [candidate division KSB1 bacterium]NIV68562.1 glucosidase [Phycisphaerae bacterium]NIR69118.1 glucosidase [candidate division KSB1 bacterium]NIS22649.1 glucosidase [candidate division KSB1 bacterium]NIT69507.1 glucosidase [candidate division KSB1 bacterium]
MPLQTAEHKRLADSEARKADWKNWGPYVSERAWGTVREDYSESGNAWEFFPHEHARSRAYRWNEDGLGGFCNRFQNICMAVALWNERDPILKERLFGLNGREGNHGEDVKEVYFYLDGTPTHSYMKMLYKYPQVEFPYKKLIEENRRRGRNQPEFELIDALPEAFAEHRYFDVFIEYAKADQEDFLCRITVHNRGPEAAPILVLPHLWFRNTWSWGYKQDKPQLKELARGTVLTTHRHLGKRWWYVSSDDGAEPELLFTENETNQERLFNIPNVSPYVKDSINDAVVLGHTHRVNPNKSGTKVAANFKMLIAPGESRSVHVRFSNTDLTTPFADFDRLFSQRIKEADEFYAAIQNPVLTQDETLVQHQAFAGLMWSKQFYHYGVEMWLKGDPGGPPPPETRKQGRNKNWGHLYNLDVLSMPDKWEYPWFAAWDLAFHCLPIALIDPEWAKRQLTLLLREWYMHPNGQIPAYEWSFSDVNPPVHAWAVWRVYKIARKITGHTDSRFLEAAFHKLLLNFTWWVNRKDEHGKNLFQGGFLGLDNIGVFDRSAPIPTGGHLEQADSTAWMGMYCLNMLAIAVELARTNPAYEDVATKFFEHFIYIAHAMNHLGEDDLSLWDPEDGFFYDVLHAAEGHAIPLKVRSFVGLIPLFAVETLEPDLLEMLPRFRRRMEWFIKYRPQLVQDIASLTEPGDGGRRLLSIVNKQQLHKILPRMLDPSQFLSKYGLRSLSWQHLHEPYTFHLDGQTYTVSYEPAESSTGMFGGNSNWRGPIWFPLNYLMIESLQKYHHYYGDDFKLECPRYSNCWHSLQSVASELSKRLINIFLQDSQNFGCRPVFGDNKLFQQDKYWQGHVPFFEYFHGDNGAGLGASHQTGWTALVAKLLQQTDSAK